MLSKIMVSGAVPDGFSVALSALEPALGFTADANGFPITVSHGESLIVRSTADGASITWAKPVQLYRALSLLKERGLGSSFTITETPRFSTLGISLDVSRNAVPTVETMQTLFQKMALMGIDLCMLYIADVFQVPQRPYFGYKRGSYSADELRQMDDFAFTLGIELCPCIQTLGHLNRALHWPDMAHLKDTENVLLIGSEEVYTFIDEMITAVSAPLRSKRIHIGMDEATELGTGRFFQENGYVPKSELMRRHLNRVADIVKQHGLHAMMWSDMFFRPESPTDGYYDGGEPSPATIAVVRPDVDLVYWDYYHNEETEYTAMLQKHRKLPANCFFAGGIWTFGGPAPSLDKTFTASEAGLRAAENAHVPLVLGTIWGDNGAEANLQAALPGIQLYAEYNYRGAQWRTDFNRRFSVCCGADADDFLSLSRFNTVPGMRSGTLRPVNAAKFLLYQDPLCTLYDKDMDGLCASAHYTGLIGRYALAAEAGSEYALLFRFYRDLACALSRKCAWHERAGSCVRSGDRVEAARLAASVADILTALEALRESWYLLWSATYKPYGFEILDLRLGGLLARFRTAEIRMLAYAEGGEPIAELLEEPLPYTLQKDGTLFGSYAWGEIVSACKTDI